MSLKVDVQRLSDGDVDNHAVLLLRLYAKSDPANRARLARCYPNAVEVYEAWYNGPEILRPGHDDSHIPDLEYDGGGR